MADENETPTTPTTEPSLLDGKMEEPKGEDGEKVEDGKVEEAEKSADGEKSEDGEKQPETAEAAEPLTAESITLPEGFEVDEASMTSFLEVMNNQDLSPKDRAQALVDLQTQAMSSAAEKQAEQWTKTQEDWQNEVRNDPDLGGTKLQGHLDKIGKIMDQYGTQELREVLAFTGAGNNIEVVRFLSKLANDLTEGGAVSGGPGEAQGKSPAEILYPNQGKG